jgi:hypothetical protein
MISGYFRNGLVFGIIILILGTTVFPLISADSDINFKRDPSFYGTFTVIGFLKMIHQSPSNDEITWECTLFALVFGMDNDNNFVLLPVRRDSNLVTRDFVNGVISIIVYGQCSYFSIE